jgi:hypothetical protein
VQAVVAAAATVVLVLLLRGAAWELLVAQARQQQERREAEAEQVQRTEQCDEQRLVRHEGSVAPRGGHAVKNARLR